MREPRRSSGRRGVLAVAAGAVAALALAVPAAQAADTCPNAAVRAAQNGAQLPECRAYEQVSDTFKNGNAIRGDLSAVSPGGGLLMYVNNTTFGDALSNVVSREVARRGPTGWTSTSMLPALTDRLPNLNDSPYLGAISPTFDSAIYFTSYPLSPDDRGNRLSTNDVYQYGADRSLSWLSRPPVLPDTSVSDVVFTAASADLSHVIVETDRALDPAFPDLTTRQFYLIVDKQQARLLSVLPDGTPSAGVYNDADKTSLGADASFSRIAFKTDDPDAPLYVREHADDPAAAQTRELTFGPSGASCLNSKLRRMTPDGRRVLVECRGTGAQPDPTAGSVSLYLGDVATGAVERLPVYGGVSAASADLSRIYVASPDQAVAGADGGSLYLIRNGELSLVATHPSNGFFPRFKPASLSADGDQIAFESDQDLGFPSGGQMQVYRYDASKGAGSLSCVSCRPDGVAASGVALIEVPFTPSGLPGAGAISSDGRRVFFTSETRLLPGDTNGVMDAYLWLDGKLHLLSSGRSPVNSLWAGASADGSEAYFTTTESLVPQDIDSGVGDLYSATVGGGFAVAAEAAPCTTGCQGPGKGLEPLPTSGTVAFTGPADVEGDDAVKPTTLVKVFSVEGIGATTRATWARGRQASVRVRLSHPGTATAVMRARIGKRSVVIARVSRTAKAGGTLSLPLRLSQRARTALAKKGVLRTTVRVTVPGAGGAQSASFDLRTAKAKAGRR